MIRWILSLATVLAMVGCGDSQPKNDPTPETTPPPPPPQAASAPGSPCDGLTEVQVATVFGVDASTVTEAEGEASSFTKNAMDCLWKFASQGLDTTVKLYIRLPSEKNQAPAPISHILKSYLEAGETIGSKTLAHEPASFGTFGEGALSEPHGNRFTRERTYSWQRGEAALYRLSLSYSLVEEDASLEDPSPETMEQLVNAVSQ